MACFHLVADAVLKTLTPDNPGSESVETPSNNALPPSPEYIQNSADMATHTSLPSLPTDNFFVDATTNHRLINKANGDWTTCAQAPGQRRRRGRLDEDVFRSERGTKRNLKASYDAPPAEKNVTRKKQKTLLSNSSYLDPILSQSLASSSSSDAQFIGFGSIQAEDHRDSYLVPFHPLYHFSSGGLRGIPTFTSPREDAGQPDKAPGMSHEDRRLNPQELYSEGYLNPSEMLALQDMHTIPRIPTWQSMPNLDHGLVAQHSYGETSALHEDQRDLQVQVAEFSTPLSSLEHPTERLAEISLI